jgi:hypothetical protein
MAINSGPVSRKPNGGFSPWFVAEDETVRPAEASSFEERNLWGMSLIHNSTEPFHGW